MLIDPPLKTIADYTLYKKINSELAYSTARYCLMDALGCAMLALKYPDCTRLLGPLVPNTIVDCGVSVPGTEFKLDPVQGAFNIGTLIRWLDFNDTWLAAEWAHPSDNLGALLAVAEYVSLQKIREKQPPLLMHDVLTAMIKAYEIQGILALNHSFNRLGFDHVILVKIASAAVAMQLFGGNLEAIIAVLSLSLIDGPALRTYRQAPNTGTRKSWAAADATSRAVRLALLVKLGEMGYNQALSAHTYGFNDVILRGEPLVIAQELSSYCIENILFKISYPAEFHAQTAVECAITLHQQIKNRLDDIEKILLTTQESAMRIINKKGSLTNFADRDHCLQYMVATALLYGDLTADYYHSPMADDPRLDFLRDKMQVEEDISFSADYLDKNKRSIANSIQIYFKDGSCSEKITLHYPLGHQKRRAESIPLLLEKFKNNVTHFFPPAKIDSLLNLFMDQETLHQMPVPQFMQLWQLLHDKKV